MRILQRVGGILGRLFEKFERLNMDARTLAPIGLVFFASLISAGYLYLRDKSIPLLQPKGTIASQQQDLLYFAVGLSVIVVVPVFFMTIMFAWKYRASNEKAQYTPDWDHDKRAEMIWWGVPILLIGILSVVTWRTSHSLDPFRSLDGDKKVLTVQVVALDWKWLFLYPEQGIATVNYVQFPKDTPVRFMITADAPMNSFWIPALGGQIYAMSGMTTELNLSADQLGVFEGVSSNISGAGFADMRFAAVASTQSEFDQWVRSSKFAADILTIPRYDELARQSIDHPKTVYREYDKNLYQNILQKYMAHSKEQESTGRLPGLNLPTTQEGY